MNVDDVIRLLLDEVGVPGPIGADTPLLTSGLVDSFGVPVLVEALEQSAGIPLSVELVGADNFDTPRDIVATLQSLGG